MTRRRAGQRAKPTYTPSKGPSDSQSRGGIVLPRHPRTILQSSLPCQSVTERQTGKQNERVREQWLGGEVEEAGTVFTILLTQIR